VRVVLLVYAVVSLDPSAESRPGTCSPRPEPARRRQDKYARLRRLTRVGPRDDGHLRDPGRGDAGYGGGVSGGLVEEVGGLCGGRGRGRPGLGVGQQAVAVAVEEGPVAGGVRPGAVALAVVGRWAHGPHMSVTLRRYAPPELYGLVVIRPPSAYWDMLTTLSSITQS
jgi:hypothetical protein